MGSGCCKLCRDSVSVQRPVQCTEESNKVTPGGDFVVDLREDDIEPSDVNQPSFHVVVEIFGLDTSNARCTLNTRSTGLSRCHGRVIDTTPSPGWGPRGQGPSKNRQGPGKNNWTVHVKKSKKTK